MTHFSKGQTVLFKDSIKNRDMKYRGMLTPGKHYTVEHVTYQGRETFVVVQGDQTARYVAALAERFEPVSPIADKLRIMAERKKRKEAEAARKAAAKAKRLAAERQKWFEEQRSRWGKAPSPVHHSSIVMTRKPLLFTEVTREDVNVAMANYLKAKFSFPFKVVDIDKTTEGFKITMVAA